MKDYRKEFIAIGQQIRRGNTGCDKCLVIYRKAFGWKNWVVEQPSFPIMIDGQPASI